MMIEIAKGLWIQSGAITSVQIGQEKDGGACIMLRDSAAHWTTKERASEVLAYLRHRDALKIAAMPEQERPEIVAEL